MTPTTDYERPPDAVITASCVIDEGSFADVDSDGVDDLVLRSDDSVYAWASSRGPGQPVWWKWAGTGEASWLDVSTPNTAPARVQWWGSQPDEAFEYEVDPATLELVLVGEGPGWYGIHHQGDVDGDGAPDLDATSTHPGPPLLIRASSTGEYTPIPGWGYQDYEPWPYEYSPTYVWSVGDLNHDGFDDIVVGQRDSEIVVLHPDAHESKSWGPAQLYLGSPTGIDPEPLWTLFAPDHPMAGVGRGVAALPDERAVVVTVVTEGTWYGDFSPELLGVIRDADTPYAYFDQLVEVPEFTPGGFAPYLEGWMDDGTGQRALAMMEVYGSTGVQWIPWFSDGTGFHPNGNGVAVPSTWWAPPPYSVLDGFSVVSFPVGRHQQAIVQGFYSATGEYKFVVWGKRLEEIGIPLEDGGVTAPGCTFTIAPWVDPAQVGGTADTGQAVGTDAPAGPSPAPRDPEPTGCGCDAGGQPTWVAGLLALLLPRRRGPSLTRRA